MAVINKLYNVFSNEKLSKAGRKDNLYYQISTRILVKKAWKEFGERAYENADTICDFIIAEQNEINIKETTKEWKIKNLIFLSKFLKNKSFKQMTKQDILGLQTKEESQNQ